LSHGRDCKNSLFYAFLRQTDTTSEQKVLDALLDALEIPDNLIKKRQNFKASNC